LGKLVLICEPAQPGDEAAGTAARFLRRLDVHVRGF
jgi:hypothetical protein